MLPKDFDDKWLKRDLANKIQFEIVKMYLEFKF